MASQCEPFAYYLCADINNSFNYYCTRESPCQIKTSVTSTYEEAFLKQWDESKTNKSLQDVTPNRSVDWANHHLWRYSSTVKDTGTGRSRKKRSSALIVSSWSVQLQDGVLCVPPTEALR
ncbi:hypothetical protein TNCV_2477931 [Trichonephila clavipes]|nr:hypothetical protein TNCV_2477931 [Trichonephila clavipes]